MTNGDRKNKFMKYFQGCNRKKMIIMEKIKGMYLGCIRGQTVKRIHKCLQLELLLKL